MQSNSPMQSNSSVQSEIELTSSPRYDGAPEDMLPQDLVLECSYLKLTRIAEWDMRKFMKAGGNPESILRSLKVVARLKSASRVVRAHAFAFYSRFSDDLGARRLRLLRNEVANELNRNVIEGNEQTNAQDRVISRQENCRRLERPPMSPVLESENNYIKSENKTLACEDYQSTEPGNSPNLQGILQDGINTIIKSLQPSKESIRTRHARSPSPMPASSVAPTMANSRPIATDTVVHMEDAGHTSLDDTESDDELQPFKRPSKYNGPPDVTRTPDLNPFLSTPTKRQADFGVLEPLDLTADLTCMKELNQETRTGSLNPLLFTPTKQQVDFGVFESSDLTADLTCMKKLNQNITWECNGVDMVKKFNEFQSTNSKNFSFALDGIADLTPGSNFETTLPSHVQSEIYLSEITPIDMYNKWPNMSAIFERVFKADGYDEVMAAVMREDWKDPVVFYLISIVVSYSHYFTFHDELPRDLNEREAFVGFSWTFIRGALTMAKIETRYLEVLITGVDERKNHDKDLRFDTKEAGQFADGIGFRGTSQIYLAEASVLHQPKAEKLLEDEFKLVRAMRDSWVSQLRATCRESIPCRAMAVFGSSSYRDETKFWMMDFKGVLRLFQIDSFLIPLKKHDFGRKMKAAALSCIELAARIQMELEKRESEAVPASYRDRVELKKALRGIRSTTPTPEKPRKRFKE
ncbi:hypothetical protein BGX20_008646 [Mortierella sp. AD010]|nr:hypothetical protein BGX20_008646 [Mortierella sp. AD010]